MSNCAPFLMRSTISGAAVSHSRLRMKRDYRDVARNEHESQRRKNNYFPHGALLLVWLAAAQGAFSEVMSPSARLQACHRPGPPCVTANTLLVSKERLFELDHGTGGLAAN
jgi:hypothetical protein